MSDLIGGIGAILIGSVFGSPLVAGLFLLFFIMVIGVALRFTLDAWVAILTSTVWLLTIHPSITGTVFPDWVWSIFAIGLGFLLAFGIIRIVRR